MLLYKCFENGRLQWQTNENTAKVLTSTQLTRLLTGWSIESTIHPVIPPKKTLVNRERIGKV
ncbi:hypothetical protein GFB64_06845 [Lacticaseibacillus paracasei]|nr:hypothetical protein GFB64_06845 [Lacticaseibacillus paracasei]